MSLSCIPAITEECRSGGKEGGTTLLKLERERGQGSGAGSKGGSAEKGGALKTNSLIQLLLSFVLLCTARDLFCFPFSFFLIFFIFIYFF